MIYGQLMVAAVVVLLKSNLKPHFNSVFAGYNDLNIYIKRVFQSIQVLLKDNEALQCTARVLS